jgi:hypothetical protein
VTELLDPAVRAEATRRLAEPWAGRPVIVGPVALAAATRTVDLFTSLGCPVLVLATSRGTGHPPRGCAVVELDVPPAATLSEEVRRLDRVARDLPPDVRREIDAFDPQRRGFWYGSPFLGDDPVDGRPVGHGRPAAYVALEDKLVAEELWDAAGVAHAAYRHVPVTDDTELAEATRDLATELGTVWVGDARDGFHGTGDGVRWVRTEEDRLRATAYFLARCDHVRVMPFLDGVPCAVHGYVLPDGTAALRPVELVVLRRTANRGFVFAGLGTTWDPPAADRTEMLDVARRVGGRLQDEHGYRGAFGVDGVLTADGFRPTELNPRMSAGVSALAGVDAAFFALLQMALLAGTDPGVGATDVEGLVRLMDEERTGLVVSSVAGASIGLSAAEEPLPAGPRMAALNLAALVDLDPAYGALEAAPDVRTAVVS